MLKTILSATVLILALFGLVNIIWTIIIGMLTPKCNEKPVLLVRLKGDGNSIEYIIRCAKAWANILSKNGCDGVLAVDCGLDDEAKQICEKLCKDNDFVWLCNSEQLLYLLENGE